MIRFPLPLLMALILGLSAPCQTLQLKNGAVLIGKVEQAHEEGLTFHRLDNGGVLELRWNHLAPECADRVRRQFGLSTDQEDEVTVTADEITYEINGVPQVALGKIVEYAATDLIVQRRGVRWKVPRRSVKTLRLVEVPVTEIYTKEEFYSSKLVELAPGEDADKHVSLADQLLRVRDYDNAERHLLRARELGTSRQPRAIEDKLRILRRYRDAAQEAELLHQISVRRHRKDFARGLELIAQFAEEYPVSRLRREFELEKQRFANARTRFLTRRVNEVWKKRIRSAAERKVAERGITLAMVKDYAGSEMGGEIAERVAEILELDIREVRELWTKRTEYPGLARRENFSYGIGSWVLGQSAILKDTQEGEEEEQSRSSAEDREIDRIRRLIKQRRERAGRNRSGRRGGEGRNTEEDWWNQADRNARVGWVRAYYVEHGGDLLVYRASVRPCINCSGSGQIKQLGTSGGVVAVECFLCHGTRYMRTLRAY